MSQIVNMLNSMHEEELILFLSRTSISYLLDIYNSKYSKDLNMSIKNYMRVLNERKFIDMYELDLYAYLRIFTTEKCLKYYIDEGLLNRKNMPYLPDVLLELNIEPDNILSHYVDQYEYYPDGIGLFANRHKW